MPCVLIRPSFECKHSYNTIMNFELLWLMLCHVMCCIILMSLIMLFINRRELGLV